MLNSILGTELTLTSFLICTGVSLLLGVGTALVAGYRSRSTQSLAVTLAILPAVVQAVIMLCAPVWWVWPCAAIFAALLVMNFAELARLVRVVLGRRAR